SSKICPGLSGFLAAVTNPPVPESWWQIIRDECPPYIPEKTPTTRLGRIPETFRSYPGVLRSSHPQAPFAAWGKHAEKITTGQRLAGPFCKDGPLEKLYELDGKILLIGAGHLNNTSLHYAEFKADIPNFPTASRAAPVLENGKRVVKEWVEIDHESDDFPSLGEDFEKSIGYKPMLIGQAESRLHSVRDMIDFASEWFKTHRKYE
ncbi:MAG: AAC(3) family N-acetyltransferase, partial [Candidatus Thorarchaeota archaeon]|nr:AAC(3) family N-acetyltransferase [Candidatus Thorarchaeota archaeon]